MSWNFAWMNTTYFAMSAMSAGSTAMPSMNAGRWPGSSPGLQRDRPVLEDPGVEQQPEVLRAGALDQPDVVVDHFVLDRGRRVDLGADDHVEFGGEVERALDRLGPDRVRHEVARDDADLRPHEAEAQPLGEAQVALQHPGPFLGREVARVRTARVQAGVDPRSVVGGFERVLLEQREPAVDPLRGRVGVALDVPLAEDLDARRAHVGDGGERRLEVEDGAVVGHEAVERDSVLERAAVLGRGEGDVTRDPVRRRLVLERDVRHPQAQLDRHLVRALGQSPLERDGDHRGLFERPAHALRVPQLLQRVGASAERPAGHVGGRRRRDRRPAPRRRR